MLPEEAITLITIAINAAPYQVNGVIESRFNKIPATALLMAAPTRPSHAVSYTHLTLPTIYTV